MASTPQRSLTRFDSDFIERRFVAHREWQQQQEAQDASEIICEVAEALQLAAQLRTGKGPQKIVRRLK